MEKVNLKQKFDLFDERWSPKIVGMVNDCAVKVAKIQGEFVWHHHAEEDEMFLVVNGQLLIKLRDREVWLDEGEFFIVPRGVEHLPIAPEEAWIMMIEPAGTLNTGNVVNDRTVEEPQEI